MLLSLVVIFTQSIQLSKIVKRFALLRSQLRALRRLETFLLKVATSLSEDQRLNLKQTIAWLHLERSQSRSYGGADRDRTGDPLLAKQVLSQLSYSPDSAS